MGGGPRRRPRRGRRPLGPGGPGGLAGRDRALRRHHGLVRHVHAHEQRRELAECAAEHGCTPIALLPRTGFLGPRTSSSTASTSTPDDVARLGATDTIVVSCPTTEGNLGDGHFPALRYRDAGVRIAIGSDSQVRVDPFEEARELETGARRERADALRAACRTTATCGRELVGNGRASLGLDGGDGPRSRSTATTRSCAASPPTTSRARCHEPRPPPSWSPRLNALMSAVRPEFGPTLPELLGAADPRCLPRPVRVALAALAALVVLALVYALFMPATPREAQERGDRPRRRSRSTSSTAARSRKETPKARRAARASAARTQSFSVRALNLPAYKGDAAGFLPLYAAEQEAQMAKELPGLRLARRRPREHQQAAGLRDRLPVPRRRRPARPTAAGSSCCPT